MLKNWCESVREWFRAQRTQEELSRLTDRELVDIGIHRVSILSVVQTGRNLNLLVTWR